MVFIKNIGPNGDTRQQQRTEHRISNIHTGYLTIIAYNQYWYHSYPGYYGTVGSGRFQSFPDRFLQTSSWKRPGTDRIFPVQFRRQGTCRNFLESAKTVPESRRAVPEPTQISTDPVAGMIDLEISTLKPIT
ncbi:unnamed protein product [Adineta ricciae]|uniref:Uncharacterized protein n=1 Tax=Adineta ricciae TaxID=249248 RepID=A0A815U0B9_ADIRI|nr:unnamed protein product [Adineta ricciae]